MHYGVIKKCDIANGPGVRVTLFVSGCRNHCKNCFQPETWNFTYGTPYTEETEKEIFEELAKPFIRGITLLGGDPFEPENQRVLVGLLRKIRENFPDKDIWSFSGYRFDDELMCDGKHPRCEVTDEMLSYLDVLVDGRFVEELKDIRLRFRGSSNQRLIDMKKTIQTGNVVLWDDGTGKKSAL